MNAQKFVERLPIGVMALSLVLVLGTLAMAASPRLRAFIRPAAGPAYQAGDRFDEAAFGTESTARTLVVVSGPNCGASERGHAFLAEAVSTALAAGIGAWLYTPEAAHPEIAQYATRLGIAPDHIVAVDPAATKITVMPTLALLAGNHAVLNLWERVPDADTGQAILRTLRADLRR